LHAFPPGWTISLPTKPTWAVLIHGTFGFHTAARETWKFATTDRAFTQAIVIHLTLIFQQEPKVREVSLRRWVVFTAGRDYSLFFIAVGRNVLHRGATGERQRQRADP